MSGATAPRSPAAALRLDSADLFFSFFMRGVPLKLPQPIGMGKTKWMRRKKVEKEKGMF